VWIKPCKGKSFQVVSDLIGCTERFIPFGNWVLMSSLLKHGEDNQGRRSTGYVQSIYQDLIGNDMLIKSRVESSELLEYYSRSFCFG